MIEINKLEVIALKSIALKDPEYFYRKICRYYSHNFHTPLMDVYNLPWSFVFNHYIEHIVETKNTQEDIYNLVVEICYPEKKVSEEQEIQDWIKRIEIEEEVKRKAKKKKEESQEIIMDNSSFAHLDNEEEG